MSLYKQKRIAVINDFCGVGRCSLTVMLPVISRLKVQCCPVPTAVFSNHSGFPSFYAQDLTDSLPAYIGQWKRLGMTFDGIATGFLGSEKQIRIVKDFLLDFRMPDTKLLVDPVMGDNGRPYQTYTEKMCREMYRLAELSDLLTPNLTEACILTETAYHDGHWTGEELSVLGRRLLSLIPGSAVISGIPMGSFLGNLVLEQSCEPRLIRRKRIGLGYPGTGDIFAAVLAADLVNGVPLQASVRRASGFICRYIRATEAFGTPGVHGVCLEEVLSELKQQ